MKIKSVEINNCFRYGTENNVFIFNKPLVLVTGSNGAGKSSIFDAITYALFEKTIRWGTTHDEIARRGSVGVASVKVIFEKDRSTFSVERSRDRRLKIFDVRFKNEVTGEDLRDKTIKLTNRKIIDVIGIEFEAFKNSVLFGQYDFNKIVSMKPIDRLGLLANLLNLQFIGVCDSAVDSQLVTIRAEIETNIIDIGTQDKKELLSIRKSLVELFESQDEKLAGRKKKFRKVKLDLDQLNRLRSLSNKSTREVAVAKDAIGLYIDQIKTLTVMISKKPKIGDIEAMRERLGKARIAYARIEGIQINIEEIEAKISELKEDLAVAKHKSRTVRQTIDQIRKRKRCVECNREYDKKTKNDLIVIQKKKLLQRTKAENKLSKILKAKLAELTKYKNSIKDINKLDNPDKLEQKIDNAEKVLNVKLELENLREEIKKKRNTIQANKNLLEEVKEKGFTPDRLENLHERILDLQGSISEEKSELRAIEKNIEQVDKKIRKAEEIETKNKKLRKRERSLEFLASMFSKSGGIKQVLVENVLPRLNSKINYYLSLLTNESLTVDFTTGGKTKSGKYKDKLEILIWTPKGAADFESYSGGEKQTIVLAIGLGFAELASESSGADCEFLLLDEIFSSLDTKSRGKLINLIYALQERFKNIVVISHIKELQAQLPYVVKIRRKKGLSRIVG